MDNLTISIIGTAGAASLVVLESRCGPCQGEFYAGSVTLSASPDKSVSMRYFDLPNDLGSAFASGGRYIAPGVLVGLGTIDRANLRADGPGAGMWQAARGTPGLRNRLPELSAGWLAAIRTAVKEG
ncbi:hypothetical protein [Novosphingobium sp.]|uniref:hypothetical protein n=1 Tax=Novosphingobium sp. TaxID=1874826 RepID=UPI003B5165EA